MLILCADCGVEKIHLARGMCHNCYHRQWKATHGDDIRARARARHAENPEPKRAAARKWQANNSTQFRACMSAWRKKNPEKYRAAQRRWEEANPGRHKATARAWKSANHDVVLGLNAKRRALKLGVFVDAVDRLTVFRRDKGFCGICRLKVYYKSKWHIDHVIPLSKGGVHSYDNVQLAHARCNLSKQGKLPAGQLRLMQMLVLGGR